jgi:hypothetical protein
VNQGFSFNLSPAGIGLLSLGSHSKFVIPNLNAI